MTKYQVLVGDEFEVSAITVETAEQVRAAGELSIAAGEARVRQLLAIVCVVALGIALLIATAVGFYDGSFNEVDDVWTAAAFPLGFVLRGYFGKG